jgi:large subunit ribosomal protein L4
LFLAQVAAEAKKSLVIVEESNEVVYKSIRNIANVTLRVAPAFSTRDVVDGGVVVITRAAAEKIDRQWGEAASAGEGEAA